MKIKFAGLEFEVMTVADIGKLGCPIVAIPTKDVTTFDHFVQGTSGGFTCSLCGQDCILAPSSQTQLALGKNPLLCSDCAMRLLGAGN